MNRRFTSALIVFTAAAVVAVATPARAAIIYADDFSGTGGPLNGAAPDTRPGTETWTAGTTMLDNGAITADADGSTAYLPFTPQSGQVYTLSAHLATGATAANFLAIGFTHLLGNANVRFFAVPAGNTDPQAVLWGSSRGSNASATTFDQTFLGPSTAGSANTTTVSADDLSIVLDTTADTWTVQWFFNGALARTATAVTPDTSIAYVAISANNGAAGTVSNFSLSNNLATTVPDPASASTALAASSLLTLARRQRKPHTQCM